MELTIVVEMDRDFSVRKGYRYQSVYGLILDISTSHRLQKQQLFIFLY